MQGPGLNLTRSTVHIVRSLGSGGAGIVYLAKLVGVNGFSREVVIKQAREGHAEYEQCLIDEAQLLGTLKHPRIIAVLDHGIRMLEGKIKVPYLMLEYGGVPLSAVQHAFGGRIEPGLAIYIALEVCSALAFAHSKEIVHRDVKPANVLIGRQGEVTLIDFGIAKSDLLNQVTTQLGVKGTMSYSSPEMFRRQKLDGRSDVWAVGVMLYEMLQGQRPWVVDDSYSPEEFRDEMRRKVLEDEVPPLDPKIPQPIAEVVYRMLEKDREKRYQDIPEVIRALLSAAPPLAKQIAETELSQGAQSAESPLSRDFSPKSDMLTVPVRAGQRAPIELVPFKLPSSMEVSMSAEELSWTADSSFTGGTPRPSKRYGDAETTDVVAESLSEGTVVTAKRRRFAFQATALVALVAMVAGGLFTWRSAEDSNAVQAQSSAAPSSSQARASLRRAPPAPTAVQAPAESAAPDAPAPSEANEALTAPAGEQPISATAPAKPSPQNEVTSRRATLTVTVTPEGGYVSLDGRSAVRAPASFSNLRAGRHVLRVGTERGKLNREEAITLVSGPNDVRLEIKSPTSTRSPFDE